MKHQLFLPARWRALLCTLMLPWAVLAQQGDKDLKQKADARFEEGQYAQAYPLYSQLVSLSPKDYDLNFRFGTCTLYGGDDKSKAIGFLEYAVKGPSTNSLAWYFLGRAYQLDYRFEKAIGAYKHFRGTADKKLLSQFPVDALEQQCRNGDHLLTNLKDIEVMSKVEVEASDFFRFYDLSDIGGKIVVTPEALLSNLDQRKGGRFLTYLPTAGGPIYFSSYGKDGRTGRDIYRSELLPTGGYSTPVKLAGYVNSDQDEDFAVMAPDGKSFYFCSKGHNSMGGYDVFKSSYDKGMDTFGAPENMDFAVNTPANELLYIVGPDGKQACFASNRDSKQGLVNVYRVGTAQTPINITILKGTYASTFDVTDRQAHIVVEDGLTGEQVADVHTDINGNYLVALPRGGNYKFLVEGGPSGRAQFQNVDVPHNEKPTVYRQEIKLVNQGGEKLVITNYFGEALPGDVMALAMDEIKRRAQLDVTGKKPQEPVAQQPASRDKPVQAAGFDGTKTIAEVMDLAHARATSLDSIEENQQQQADAAYAMAVRNVAAAEELAGHARNLVHQAKDLPPEEQAQAMRQAAEAKQLSQAANSRAKAALRTAQGMESAQMATGLRATSAKRVATSISAAKQADDPSALTASLKELKVAIEKENGPERALGEVERTQRAASAAAAEATRKLNQANAQRGDETRLAERVRRLASEMEQAKGNRKEEMARDHAELSGQQAALHEEVEEAFTQAKHAEADAALARGQAALANYLEQNPGGNDLPAVTKEEISGVGQRMANVYTDNMALVIGPQYAPLVAINAQEQERRTFDWGHGPEGINALLNSTGTLAQASNGTSDAVNNPEKSQTTPGTNDNATRSQQTETGEALARAAGTAAEANAATDKQPQAAHGEVNMDQGTGRNQPGNDEGQTNAPVEQVRDSSVPAASQSAQVATTGTLLAAGQDTAVNAEQDHAGSGEGADGADAQHRASANETRQGQSTSAAATGIQPAGDAAGSAAAPQAAERNDRTFLLENKLAELEQIRKGVKDKAKRDSLDKAIDAQRSLIASFQAAPPSTVNNGLAESAGNRASPVEYRLLEYDPTILDEQMVEEAYPGFALRRKAIAEGPGSATDKANMIHALEMDLLDSIDVRMAQVVALLDAEPSKAEQLLPQLERWRKLKEAHVEDAAQVLAQVNQTYVASETRTMEAAQLAAAASQQPAAVESQGESPSPHNDAYITVEPDLAYVYTSPLAPRSKKVEEAVGSMVHELERSDQLQVEIDSLEEVLDDMPVGKPYDKLRERTDRKIDDLLIAKVDMGQRTAFISRSEYAAAQDSAKGLVKTLAKQGLPPDEPLVQLARSLEASAKASMDQAKDLRKQADRSGDVLKRDVLYRKAWAQELAALRNIDRSHTVRNWLLSGNAVSGEALTYEQVEQHMFPPQLAAQPENQGAAPVVAQVQAAADTLEQEIDGEASGNAPETTSPSSGADTVQQDLAAVGATTQDRAMARTSTAAIAHPAARVPTSAPGATNADSTLLSGYLEKYYYLTPEERGAIMDGEQEHRYFLMKGRSMAKRGEAETVHKEAEGSQALAADLREAAVSMRTTSPADAGAAAQATALEARAEALMQRSDSLLALADRMLGSAAVDDAQAAAWMQSMPADRSAAIMDLEQANRRTEPVLARTRPAATAQAEQDVHGEAPVLTQTRAEVVPGNEVDGSATTARQPAVDRSNPGVERMAATRSSIGAAPAPFTGPLTQDVFAFAPVETPRVEAIPIDVPMPEGVVYKVQVGAFRTPIPLDAFNDMTPVTGEHAGNGLVRYTAGMFTTAKGASEASAMVRSRGYRDAFVVAYIDGKRIPLREAMRAEARAARPVPSLPSAAIGEAVTQAAPSVEPVQLPQTSAEAAVLAQYPTTAEEVLASFTPAPTDYYNDPNAAPAKQVETVKGLFFTVQVGVYSKPTPLDRLFNISPLNSERTSTGKIRYTTGIFLGEDQAQRRKGVTVSLGVTDAFVTAYLNGNRIPIRDARALMSKFGNAILVDPALGSP